MSQAPVRERLYKRLAPCPDRDCDCLLWTAGCDPRGYGRIQIGAESRYVHRVIWELEVGPIPAGLGIDHVVAHGCRHRHCAGVGHLEPVSHHVNVLRGRVPNPGNALRALAASGERRYGGHFNLKF